MREAVEQSISRSANEARWLAPTAVLVGAATLIASLAGAFGTLLLPIGARFFIFGAVIGFNAVKWTLWMRLVSRRSGLSGRLASEAGGALLLNLSLSLELELAFRALGYPADLPFWPIYGLAVVISLLIGGTIATVQAALARQTPAPPPRPGTLPSFLRRAGIGDPADLLAVEAEDHYVRLHLADGRKPLLLHGFGAAIAELEPLAGLQVHRGAWVAEGAVAGAQRERRKWRLRLRDGTIISVSDRYLAAVRTRGWLERLAAR